MKAIDQRAEGFFLRALGLAGLGRADDSRRSLGKALKTHPSHLEAVEFQRSLPPPPPRPSGPQRRRIEAPPGAEG